MGKRHITRSDVSVRLQQQPPDSQLMQEDGGPRVNAHAYGGGAPNRIDEARFPREWMNSCEVSLLRQPVCSFECAGRDQQLNCKSSRDIGGEGSHCHVHLNWFHNQWVRGESSFRSNPALHRDKCAVVAQQALALVDLGNPFPGGE